MAKILLRSITPKGKIFDIDQFDRDSEKLLNKVIDSVEKDFKSTYPKPDYKKQRARKGKASLSSNDEILNYNVLGTKPHIIRARNASVLSFRTGYRRKTRNRTIGRQSGGASGPRAFTKEVRHPGFEGTHVDETIADKHQPILSAGTKKNIKRATS